MKRIFSMAASISIFLILLASCGSYWFSTESLYNSKKLSIKTAANQLANSMALQMSIYQQIVDRLAISPEVNLAFLNADTEQLNNLALKLQALLPGALKIKLLTANMILNQSNLSQLSYGDLEMVKASLTNKQKPVLQGEGQERHLALTATVKKDSEVIGIILVSFPADIAKHVFATNPLNNGFAELKQDQLVITSTGNSMTKQGDSESIAIPNTRWHILLWSDPSIEIEDLGLITSILFLPIILIILIFILCYKKLSSALVTDQTSIMHAAKDMMAGIHGGNYPILLDELRPIINALVQYKWSLAQNNSDYSKKTILPNEINHFDATFNLNLLEMDTTENNSNASVFKIPD